MNTYRVLAPLLMVSAFAVVGGSAAAADFCVENAVYVEGQSQPQSQGVTIFHEGLVYDFLNDPAEVIIFDKAHQRFVLIDITRHVRSEVSVEAVKKFVDRAQQILAGRPNREKKWLADPAFEESFDRGSGELTLKSPAMTYRAQVQPTDPAVAAQYHEFSDWYAKLNHVFSPQSRPPFPRMALNDAIERSKGVAKEVHLSTTVSYNGAPMKITSRHQLALQLNAADLNRVAEARQFEQNFQAVSINDYCQGK